MSRLFVPSKTRRSFMLESAAAGTIALTTPATIAQAQSREFWPGGARLAVLVSMIWESGAEPPSTVAAPGAGSTARFPDLQAQSDIDYGFKEGIPRMLELYRRANVPVTAFMCGRSAALNPGLAKEVAQRGHECAAHGETHSFQYQLARDDERAFIAANVESIVKATGQRPLGYNCRGQQRSVNTAALLQELGFLYHIDDYSRDEPFLVPVNGAPFAVVPYTQTLSDVRHFRSLGGSNGDFEQSLKDEFDMLYAEAGQRRRMMVVTMHDEVAGRAARIPVFDRFFTYAKRHPGVWFAQTSEVARWALASPLTPREERAT